MRKKWTAARNRELCALYKIKTAPELAAHFNTTVQAIYVQAHKIGLNKPQPNKIELTQERELWLRINFPHMSNEICALILGISPRTVVRFARRLNISKTEQFIRECQAHTAKKARESHLRNGSYPAKGFYSPNLQKGKKFQFKPGENRKKEDKR